MRHIWMLWLVIAFAVSARAQDKPNVVFILADNVGYGDLGPMAAANCAARRRRASTSWRARGCG